jgi:hypothetical protein
MLNASLFAALMFATVIVLFSALWVRSFREKRAASEVSKLDAMGGSAYRLDLRNRWLAGDLKGHPSWELRIFWRPVECCKPIPGYRVQLGHVVDGQKQVLSDTNTTMDVEYVHGIFSRIAFRLAWI